MKTSTISVVSLLVGALFAIGCGDASSKGKYLPPNSGAGDQVIGGDDGTILYPEDEQIVASADRAIFGSAPVRDSSGTEIGRMTTLFLNDTVDVCPLIPRSCDEFNPDIGEAHFVATLVSPGEVPIGDFSIVPTITEETILSGELNAQVSLFGYDEARNLEFKDALNGFVSLDSVTESQLRGELYATFPEGDVTVGFDAEECPAITYVLSNCF